MPVKIGDAVELRDSSVSMAGGEAVTLNEGLVGRVCRITPFGFCCVEFVDIGCRRVHQDRLRPTTKRAPQCSEECLEGC